MSHRGKFVWFDAMTTDLKAAENFCSSIAGWTFADSAMPGATPGARALSWCRT